MTEFEWATRYSYPDDPDPNDPGCVDPVRGVWRYLDGSWSDNEVQARENFEHFAARHGPSVLVELLRRPVGQAEVIDIRGSLGDRAGIVP